MSGYQPITIEKVFELLNNNLVAWGVPGALIALGLEKIRQNLWRDASWCFALAVGVGIVIKVGRKLAPKIDQVLDWAIIAGERSLGTLTSSFTELFLRQQAQLNEEATTEGFNPDLTKIPLLEEVFVPLELSGALGEQVLGARIQRDPALFSENLSIWELLRRSQRKNDRSFRQMSILAKGGMGKTTLLRHIALIYGQHKQRRYRAPGLVPILLRLRNWVDDLTQPTPPTLPKLITERYLPKLWEGYDHPPTPPDQWAGTLLRSGKALVMLDGFDEIPEDKRADVSHWISRQMQQYAQSVFILTSRPAGFKDYVGKKPAIPIFVKKFSVEQQTDFIRRWYLCQEKCFRSVKQVRQAKATAKQRSDDLINQLEVRRAELGYMAENPLLLNMLVTFHRFDPTAKLPRQRLELYRGICKLQLEDRPKARLIRMLLSYQKNNILLQKIALGMMVKAKRLTLPKQALLKFLAGQSLLTQEEVEPADWLKQIVEVSELMVEREPGNYEFPHVSFQGFFAANLLAQPEDDQTSQNYAQLVLDNWNEAIWKETVLLYAAQLSPRTLNTVIRQACAKGSEAAQLARECLKEYPRPDRIEADLQSLLDSLDNVAQGSKYQKLETLLKAQWWREADQETYRLMITTVGKERGQLFDREDFLNFPCDDLKTIDGLWVKYSGGKFGFSVQQRIYVEAGNPLDGEYHEKAWDEFCDRVGWRKGNSSVSYSNLKADLHLSPPGEFPVGWGGFVGFVAWVGFSVWGGGFSSLSWRLVNCSE